MRFADDGSEAALVMQLIYLRDQQTSLVPENVVDHIRLVRVVNAILMPHYLSSRVHLECQVSHKIL